MTIIQFFSNKIQPFFDKLSNLSENDLNLISNFKKQLQEKLDTIQKLNKKIKILTQEINELKGINKPNIPEDSISPSYNFFEADKSPIIKKIDDSIDYLELIKDKKFKISKIVKENRLPKPEQCCPKCNSPKEYHSLHTKNQKKCKCCNYHFNINSISEKSFDKKEKFCCPYCNKTLEFRAKRSSYDVYVCKNQKCSYYLDKVKNRKHNLDKVHYIYRHINLKINDVYQIIEDSKTKVTFNFRFRKFNMDILSKVLTLRINSKLSTRDTAQALYDLFGIEISHTQVANYCTRASYLISLFNTKITNEYSNNLVADETYIKVKGQKHYVWIIYDRIKETVVSSFISSKRDTTSCITAIVKSLKKYVSIPETIKFASDGFTAYPISLQYVSKEFQTIFNHTTVKGLQIQEGENSDTRNAKQEIERLNRTFKESYRITTGYGTLQGSRNSMELWMFYYNYLRKKEGKFLNSLDFIDSKIDIDSLTAPLKWALTLQYCIDNFIT